MEGNKERPSLLTLPYDIRFLIYQHLFPPGNQIYIQALHYDSSPKPLRAISPAGFRFPIGLLLTNRALNHEAAGYLYNSYLFNIVGLKPDCLKSYTRLEDALEKYARQEVRVEAFSNGGHSQTMCMSLYCGQEKSNTVEMRKRGVLVSIQDVAEECGMMDARSRDGVLRRVMRKKGGEYFGLAMMGLGALFAVLLACFVVSAGEMQVPSLKRWLEMFVV